MNGACEYTAAVTALANTLAERMTDDELVLLSAALTQLRDTLTTIALHKKLRKNLNKPPHHCPRDSGKAEIKTKTVSSGNQGNSGDDT
ncbi:MAG TPA: hypothetical protein DEQ02_05785 [Ruminococcaceae bacterium]|nr:hypothetical protein [Oscillospiraceae bacterium]